MFRQVVILWCMVRVLRQVVILWCVVRVLRQVVILWCMDSAQTGCHYPTFCHALFVNRRIKCIHKKCGKEGVMVPVGEAEENHIISSLTSNVVDIGEFNCL